ncbi:involucrin repeat protein [Diaporthe amygdali]|uniref:involucrin repeat protein n=1 Tax=Phomopsis amygdali TaxID=1214568 RepID=UPI0022FE06F1|nr:involucrin repeat protein [Diaporthe amygdali]KAJ0125027.1 involucrin repeat protein [Diaporthe amygdali]
MNGNYGNNDRLLSPTQAVGPGGRQIMEGYRKDIMNGFAQDQPRYNPLNVDRTQSSPHVDLKDPIQVHLLTETALTDSKEWEILAQEEVDDLKKQIQSLTVRIEQARANLAIQTKYRDAAISMSKLYTAGKRGNRATVDPNAQETAVERQESERRCEELATELFNLEKEILAPQRRLLQHTAAILQLTHKASSKRKQPPAMLNGMPGSPESLYTYTNGRNSMQFPSDDLDRDLYFPLDEPEGFGRSLKSDIPIPPRSPVRERSNQLRDEVETLKKQTSGQLDVITNTERSLEDLTSRLRDLVVQMNPTKNGGYRPAPSGNFEPGELVNTQLAYVAECLSTIQRDQQGQSSLLADSARKSDNSAGLLLQAEDRLDLLSRQVYQAVRAIDEDQPGPPLGADSGIQERFDWIESALPVIQRPVAKDSSAIQDAEQIETVLVGLWDIIQSGYADINRQREARREVRLGKGMPDDDDDVSADESFDFEEAYSLNAFSTKVQWLFRQATSLKEQKSVLKRQIRQQRDLNSKTDTEKDVELRTKVEELNRTKNLLAFCEESAQQSKTEAAEAQEKLARALADLDSLQVTQTANETAATSAVQDQLRERNAKIVSLESDTKALQDKLEIIEAQLGSMNEQLKEADDAKQAAENEKWKLEEQMRVKDEEMEQLNVSMIETKTELTIAKAELEGAYGSRSERAAEAAALTKSSQMQSMVQESEKLKAELAATLKDLEELTKETLASEKEKVDLEGRLDEAEATRSTLEADIAALRTRYNSEVTKLKEQLDAEKFKAGPNASGTGPRAGATMLSEQFRATMKEERKKFQEDLREEQNKRRKLEDELRALKKTAGPVKSPLTPR